MIETENAANDRSVNSLINFETVKFFGMERRECCLLEEFIVKCNKVFFLVNFSAWNEGESSVVEDFIVAYNILYIYIFLFFLFSA